MQNNEAVSEPSLAAPTDCLTVAVYIAMICWIGLNTVFIQPVAWIVDQALQSSGIHWPIWVWPLISLTQGLLLFLPAILLGWLWPNKRYRGLFRTWAAAAALVLLYIPIHFVNPMAALSANFLQILLTFLALIVILTAILLSDKRFPRIRVSRSLLLAIAAAGLIVYSWFAWGALGSPLDTLINLLAGLVFGLLMGIILVYVTFQPLRLSSDDAIANIVLGGLTAGTALLIAASGFGFSGMQLILMLVLPALGWLASQIFEWFGNKEKAFTEWVVPAVLIGIVTAIPMMFVDPDELSFQLALGTRDLLSWVAYAALVSLGVGLLLCLILGLIHTPLSSVRSWKTYGIGASAVWLGSIFIYFFVGQPGFFGDQLFVILTERADLSAASQKENYDERRQYVYNALTKQASSQQAALAQDLDRLSVNYVPYYLVNAIAVDGGPILRLWLEARPEVDRVLTNPVLRPLKAPPAANSGSAKKPDGVPWNLSLIRADKVWNELGVTGEGIIVGQSDSGVQGDHPEFASSYRGRDGVDNYNWFDPWNNTSSPTDLGGHGTHTLGTIVGRNTGVAPGAEWFGCANLARNLANPALYLDCMQFMLAPFPHGGDPFTDGNPLLSAHVLNNSWGCPEQEGCEPSALLDAVRALRAAGIFMVAAAGNEGPACESIRNPIALYDEVFSVGAIDQAGELALFSSLGPVSADGSKRTKPDIVAPGVDVLSSYTNDSYEYFPGTSMAGPHVTGVVALMWSANPNLIGNIELTEQILIETAQPYEGSLPVCVSDREVPNNGVGYGIVDAFEAVKRALALR